MGRALIAIKDDPLAARYMGINTSREKVIAFVISSVIAGVAGVFYAILSSFIEPRTFTADMSTVVLCIVIFGGMGSIPGMLVGATLLILFPEVLRSLSAYRFIVYGIILIVMMRFRPQGILGGLSSKPYKLPKDVVLEMERR
jgi:branched-chain amino acid transport system permease protein